MNKEDSIAATNHAISVIGIGVIGGIVSFVLLIILLARLLDWIDDRKWDRKQKAEHDTWEKEAKMRKNGIDLSTGHYRLVRDSG